MGEFIGELVLKRDGSKYWRTAKELLYINDIGIRIKVPAGFQTDGASIPRIFWSIVGHPLNGKHARAAVIHDFMYEAGIYSKENADNTFLEAMKADGVSKIRRTIIYYAVKLFGDGNFKN
jgi:hypothetical protein